MSDDYKEALISHNDLAKEGKRGRAEMDVSELFHLLLDVDVPEVRKLKNYFLNSSNSNNPQALHQSWTAMRNPLPTLTPKNLIEFRANNTEGICKR